MMTSGPEEMDFAKFRQGAIPDKAWQHFCRVVEESHLACRLRNAARAGEADALAHLREAAGRAEKQMDELSYVVDLNSTGALLYYALRSVISRRIPQDEIAFGKLAFTDFDPERELAGNPQEVVTRWSKRSESGD